MNESILNNYPGKKSNTGIIQFLINNIPVHDKYYELFLGSGNLFLNKRPASTNILADIDKNVIDEHLTNNYAPATRLYNCSYKAFLAASQIEWYNRNDFFYLDPPYPESARRNGKKYYAHEMLSDAEHLDLLTKCQAIDANIMISTRHNQLYSQVLSSWRMKEFHTMDRGGKCVEVIYMNYPEPEHLHQYDYLGEGFGDRQRIKRKIDRLLNKLDKLPQHEKNALIVSLTKNNYAAVDFALALFDATEKIAHLASTLPPRAQPLTTIPPP